MNLKLIEAKGLVNMTAGKTLITYPEIVTWCHKMRRYTRLDKNLIEEIACTKLNYVAKNYHNLVRHNNPAAVKPLESILSKEHAQNIYHAYKRHKHTKYDKNLQDLHKLEASGILKEHTYKNIARKGVGQEEVEKVLRNEIAELDESLVKFIKNRLN